MNARSHAGTAPIRYVSTRDPVRSVTFPQAVLDGLAPDGGLYRPSTVPRLDGRELARLSSLTFPQTAFRVLRPWLSDEISDSRLAEIVESAFDFPVPLRTLPGPGRPFRVLELFHGPSLAFKDFGARFMARLLPHLNAANDRPLTILTATSGDTGAAVAQGFHEVPGIRVAVLFPRGRVSELQEKQLTALGGNVRAFRVEGTFDDCQRLVKQAFLDPDLRTRLRLTTANSINWARLLPQITYYFWLWSRLTPQRPVTVSVPSGNFGNLCAGLLARLMGLPIRLVAAVNANDSVVRHLETGSFDPRPTIATLSSAMDVGRPSNWERIQALYDGDRKRLRRHLQAFGFSDSQTSEAIGRWNDQGYRFDPHSAVAFLGLEREARLRPDRDWTGVLLATAHPAKFPEAYRAAGRPPAAIPKRLQDLVSHTRTPTDVTADWAALKDVI